MDENKWSALFKKGKGKGLYYIMMFPYVFMLVIMFPLSVLWFKFINFEHTTLAASSVILLLTLSVVFKIPKVKKRLMNIHQESL